MKTNTSVILTVNDKQYTLKFDIKALLTLEQLISMHNITKMMVNPPLSHADTVNCLYVGLKAGAVGNAKNADDNEAETETGK